MHRNCSCGARGKTRTMPPAVGDGRHCEVVHPLTSTALVCTSPLGSGPSPLGSGSSPLGSGLEIKYKKLSPLFGVMAFPL